MSTLDMIVDQFGKTKILVVGDVMLDYYIYGDASRLSPEAPVPVVNVSEEKYVLGGAANVAANISALGGKAYLCGVVGNDRYGRVFGKVIDESGIEDLLCRSSRSPTTVKMRVVANRQQTVRVDFEKNSDNFSKEMYKKIRAVIDKVDLVVFSDYNKGVFSNDEVGKFIDLIRNDCGKSILVDPKPVNMGYFKGVDCVTPNLKEAKEIVGTNLGSADKRSLQVIASSICREYNSKYSIITCGEHGIYAFDPSGKDELIPAKAKEVYDVSGAGDTVLAVLAMALARGTDIFQASRLANAAGGVVVGKLGTATLSQAELKRNLR